MCAKTGPGKRGGEIMEQDKTKQSIVTITHLFEQTAHPLPAITNGTPPCRRFITTPARYIPHLPLFATPVLTSASNLYSNWRRPMNSRTYFNCDSSAVSLARTPIRSASESKSVCSILNVYMDDVDDEGGVVGVIWIWMMMVYWNLKAWARRGEIEVERGIKIWV